MKLWLLAVLESMFNFDKNSDEPFFQQSNRSMGLDILSTKETGSLSQDQLLLDVPCLIFSRGISLFIKLYIQYVTYCKNLLFIEQCWNCIQLQSSKNCNHIRYTVSRHDTHMIIFSNAKLPNLEFFFYFSSAEVFSVKMIKTRPEKWSSLIGPVIDFTVTVILFMRFDTW